MVVVEEKRIGSVRITKPAPAPTPVPTPISTPIPTPKAKPSRMEILGDFLDEHKRVKQAMEKKAGAECILRKEILDEIGISEKRLDLHLRILKNTNLATNVTDDMICSYANLKDLKKRMERMR